MKVQILVASHKQYKMPRNTKVYLPIFVGAALVKEIPSGFHSDAVGDNISSENSKFNELTAVYWAWKNSDAAVIGLDHYRRYFVSKKSVKKTFDNILNEKQILDLLKKGDIILPCKRRYYIETIESHYLHSHDEQGLLALKQTFSTFSETYNSALEKTLSSRSAHMFNMFIMKSDDFRQYSAWLFSTLRAIEKRIDYVHLKGNEKRVLGFISEILMDVWVRANHKKVVECPVQVMESNHWPKKIRIFLINKIKGGKSHLNTHIN